MSDKYNGWTNYETWNVALWLHNDEVSYNYWEEQTSNAETVEELASQLEQEVKDQSPARDASLYTDLLGAALSEVNWYEIAKDWKEEQESVTKFKSTEG